MEAILRHMTIVNRRKIPMKTSNVNQWLFRDDIEIKSEINLECHLTPLADESDIDDPLVRSSRRWRSDVDRHVDSVERTLVQGAQDQL